jgi:uncharacterized protein with PIN domain
MKTEKPSAHILELRYAGKLKDPELSPSKRRANRERLKSSLTQNETKPFQNDDEAENIQNSGMKFADGVLEKMDADRILTEDVYAVIAETRRNGTSAILHAAGGIRSGSLVIGRTTCWVDFAEKDEEITITSVYAHRLAIELEDVWAGVRRADIQKTRAESDTNPQRKSYTKKDVLICESCDAEMKEMDAEFSYLGRAFRHKVMRCPVCGLVYIPEELARGRMRQVEMALEDK